MPTIKEIMSDPNEIRVRELSNLAIDKKGSFITDFDGKYYNPLNENIRLVYFCALCSEISCIRKEASKYYGEKERGSWKPYCLNIKIINDIMTEIANNSFENDTDLCISNDKESSDFCFKLELKLSNVELMKEKIDDFCKKGIGTFIIVDIWSIFISSYKETLIKLIEKLNDNHIYCALFTLFDEEADIMEHDDAIIDNIAKNVYEISSNCESKGLKNFNFITSERFFKIVICEFSNKIKMEFVKRGTKKTSESKMITMLKKITMFKNWLNKKRPLFPGDYTQPK